MTTASTTATAPDCHDNNNEGRGLRQCVLSPKILFIVHNDDNDRWGLRHVISSPALRCHCHGSLVP